MSDNKVNTITELILSFVNPTPFILNKIIKVDILLPKTIKAVDAVRAIIRYLASDVKGNDAMVSLLQLIYGPKFCLSNDILGSDLSCQWLRDLVCGHANTNAYDNIDQVTNALKEINNNTLLDLYLSNDIIHMLLSDTQAIETRYAEKIPISNKFSHRLIMHGRIENTKVIYLKWIDYIIDSNDTNELKGLVAAQLARFDRLPRFLNPNKESGFYIKFFNNCEEGDIVYPNISAELMSTLGFYSSTSHRDHMTCDYNGTKNQVICKADSTHIIKGRVMREPDIDKSKNGSVLYCCGDMCDNKYDGRILIRKTMY
jgi:hypothetical protein